MEGSESRHPGSAAARLVALAAERDDEARSLRALLDGAAVGLALLDENGRFLSVNRALVDLLGQEEEALLGIMVPELLEGAAVDTARGALTGAEGSHEWSLRRADGTSSEVRVTLSALPEDASGRTRFAATVERLPGSRDVLYRELKASEARLHALVEASPLGIVVMDRDGYPVFYNPMAEELHGIPIDAAARNGWADAVHPEDRERVTTNWYEAARSGTRWADTYRFRHPDGRIVWVSGRAAPMRLDGEMIGFVGTLEDITALKAAEAELADLLARERAARAEAERRARGEGALRRAAAAVVACATSAEATREIARSALAATGADGALVERITEDGRRLVIEAAAGRGTPVAGRSVTYEGSLTQRVIEGSEAVIVERLAEVTHRVPQGIVDLRPSDAALAVPLRGQHGVIGGLVLLRSADRPRFDRENLERARIFADLAALAFDKIRLLEESEGRRRDLERVIESRARLMRGFSHDVRNPLGGADGFLALLQEGIGGMLPAAQMDKITRARRAIARSVHLLEDLLTIARAEAGQIDVRWGPTDVLETVREVAETYRVQAAAKGLDLGIFLPGDLPPVRSDADRIGQVLSNLLSNAVKYTDRGRIDVTVAERAGTPTTDPGDWITIEVRDTGAGIPPEKRHLLFREFTRLDPAGRHGAGVGLAMSRMIAEALGGRLTASSEPGAGSVFTLWLPSTRNDGD